MTNQSQPDTYGHGQEEASRLLPTLQAALVTLAVVLVVVLLVALQAAPLLSMTLLGGTGAVEAVPPQAAG